LIKYFRGKNILENKHLLEITYSIKRGTRNHKQSDFIERKSFDDQNFHGAGY